MEWKKRLPIWDYDEFNSPLEKISCIRGITDIDSFLNPQSDVLHSPYLLKNVELASKRIVEAILNNENICIVGDEDFDGVSSLVVKLRYLRNYTNKVIYVYGHRSAGHGINIKLELYQIQEEDDKETIAWKKEMQSNLDNASLIIIVDSSTNDVEGCKILTEQGKTVLILDHHAIERENNFAIIVNPQQESCNYPNKQLSGVAVVFKVLQVVEEMLREKGLDNQVNVWNYIDLVACGMYADVMKIDNLENRYLIYHGMRNIKNQGLIRILKGGNADLFNICSDDIGFKIAPMINGACRLDQINLAIDILLEDNDDICKKLRLKIHKLNEERKVKQKEIAERYKEQIDLSKKIIFVADDFSSSGYNGLVATQLVDEFKKCVIVGRLKEGFFRGSFRSHNDFKLKTFLQNFDGEIEAMGHEPSGGIVVKEELLEKLKQYIEDNLPESKDESNVLEYDLEININEVEEYIPIIMQVNQLTGNGFPKVLVKVNDITVQDRKVVGKSFDTIRIDTMDNVGLIKFRVHDMWAKEVSTFSTIDVIGALGINKWYHNGEKRWVINNQIMIEDYKCK